MEEMKQYQRIQEVVTYWWERLSKEFTQESILPTLVIYYHDGSGHYKQHAKLSDTYIAQKASDILSAFKKEITSLKDKNLWNDVTRIISEHLADAQGAKQRALNALLNDMLSGDDLRPLCHILNNFLLSDFPLKKLLKTSQNEIFYYSEESETGVVKKKAILDGVIPEKRWKTLESPEPLMTGAFLFFNLLERCLLFSGRKVSAGNILPLRDPVGYLGNVSLFVANHGNELGLNILQKLLHDTVSKMIPEIRSALEFEAQVKLMTIDKIDALSSIRTQRAEEALREILWFIQDVKDVTADSDLFHIAYRDTSTKLLIDRNLAKPPANQEPLDDTLLARWREITRLGVMFQQRRQTLSKARSTAVTAIMSRNLSHNIGSHVLARLSRSEDVEGITNRADIATFNNYLRSRMDFLADISTQSPLAGTSLSLYRDVIGDLWPHEKDRDRFSGQKLLIDRISGLNAVRSGRIKIAVKNRPDEVSLKRSDLDPLFASPNGWVGTHALYNIIENFIRNSARHGEVRDDLEISIEFEMDGNWDDRENLFKVTMYDNLLNCISAKEIPAAELNKKLAVIEELNHAIEQSLIDDAGVLQPKNWGIREMKICAAYLRKIPPEELDIDFSPPLLRAVKVDGAGEDKKGHLGYEFYLQRPKELLVVGPHKELEEICAANDKLLTHRGIKYRKSLKEGDVKDGIDHNFMLVLSPDETVADLIKKYRDSLPVRLLIGQNTMNINYARTLQDAELQEVIKELKTDDPEKAVVILWNRWLMEALRCKAEHVVLGITEGQDAPWWIDGLSVNIVQRGPGEPFKPYIFRPGGSPQPFNVGQARFVLYDRHGELIVKEGGLGRWNCVFYEPYNQYEAIATVTQYPPKNERIKLCMAYELIEAGLTRVAILDERVQGSLQGLSWKYKQEQQANKWLELMNIKVPEIGNREIDLNAERLDQDAIEEWITSNAKSDFFLIIHQGVLDRMGLQNSKKSEGWIEKIKNDASIEHVVVDSGRGVPDNVPQKARFIHLSNLLRWTVERKSKYHLCKSLFSSRRAARG